MESANAMAANQSEYSDPLDSTVIVLQSEDDTERLGQSLAELLPESCVVTLDGTLGAGKTRLVRAFATACGISSKDVTSPTFTLWQTYHGSRTIHHLDAYRISDEDEFDALGVYECFDGEAVTFIEWADRISGCLPLDRLLHVRIEVIAETEREVTLSAKPGDFDVLPKISARFVSKP